MIVEYPASAVWYIEARPWNENGMAPADPEKMGSGVVVELEQLDGESNSYAPRRIKKYILTCAHVVRRDSDDSLLREIVCFPPGKGYLRTEKDSRRSGSLSESFARLARVSSLSPCGGTLGARPESLQAASQDDWVLLEIDDEAPSIEERFQKQDSALGWAQVKMDESLKVIGYPGGAGTIAGKEAARRKDEHGKAHYWISGYPIEPAAPEDFEAKGNSPPGLIDYIGDDEVRPGMSGGGVFWNNKLVGIHRSSTDVAMRRGAIEADEIEKWLLSHKKLRPIRYAESTEVIPLPPLSITTAINGGVGGAAVSGSSRIQTLVPTVDTGLARWQKKIGHWVSVISQHPAKHRKEYLATASGGSVCAIMVSLGMLECGTFGSVAQGSSGFRSRFQRSWSDNNRHVFNEGLNARVTTRNAPEMVRHYQTVTLSGTEIPVRRRIVVEQGGTLVIEPGAHLSFDPGTGLEVHGVLKAKGGAEPGKNIVFTAAAPAEGWRGILFRGPGVKGSKLDYSEVSCGRGTPLAFNVDSFAVVAGSDGRFFSAPNPPDPKGLPAGGGLVFSEAQGVQLENCLFTRNLSQAGGAAYIHKSNELHFVSCRFEGNLAYSEYSSAQVPVSQRPIRTASPGGAVFLQDSHSINFRGCQFTGNQSLARFSCGGAIYAGFWASCSIVDCHFKNNVASNAGGAIYALSSTPRFQGTIRPMNPESGYRTTVDIAGGTFTNNRALAHLANPKSTWASHGSEIAVDLGTDVKIQESEFLNNTSEGRMVQADDNQPADEFRSPRTSLSATNLTMRSPWTSAAEIKPFGSYINQQELAIISPTVSHVVVAAAPPATISPGLAGVTDRLMMPESRIFGGKTETYSALRPSEVKIDTVVIHHVSAINWDEPGAGINEEIKAEMASQAATLHGDAKAFSPELCRAIFLGSGVSCHYMIDREGQVFRLVPESLAAWHAGVSKMPAPDDRTKVNDFSIGIELIGMHPSNYPRLADPEKGKGYTPEQYESLRSLLLNICGRHPITHVVGHDEIAGDSAISRGIQRDIPKTDPGPDFDWSRVRQSGSYHPILR
ncbi:N-acetylmuramoyl-L-alanine amidase [Luteolibacter flavescens]|uniref:1,6-anhydro-N-acetylmuramyl-L-alanine amidase AmpD n=1 Tax=Luteolibacter flavescens TaxID=1859460 RepID=A0ABT3FTV4_9BACT|nr:N-acetylmuramoyl-L-alanine amidase [Luteolibacter flavescens]MCW1887013.1 N-acetylmuramoyl-L-alanine amidase [Luteolibacter flavescens]